MSRARRFVALLLVCLVWLSLDDAFAAQPVTYTDDTGARWCASITTTDAGADGLRWAWIVIEADPRRVFHVPITMLTRGCS